MSVNLAFAQNGATGTDYATSGNGWMSNSGANQCGLYGTLTVPPDNVLSGIIISSGSSNLLQSGKIYVTYQ
jgi:hypothetical protein